MPTKLLSLLNKYVNLKIGDLYSLLLASAYVIESIFKFILEIEMAFQRAKSEYFLCPQDKAGPHKEIYPYVIQELRPTLNELGISTPEELGLDKV